LKDITFASIMKSSEELQSFVKNKLKRGYPEGELRNDLLQEGYTAEQIQKAIYDPPTDPGEIKKAERKKTDDNPLWYLASIGIVITGVSLKSTKYYADSSWGNTLIIAGLAGLALKIILPYIEDHFEKK
jgi:hypothetical protein